MIGAWPSVARKLATTMLTTCLIAFAAAWGIYAFTEEPERFDVSIASFAAPGEVVVGQRATTFGMVRTSEARQVILRFEVCRVEGEIPTCTRQAPITIQGPTTWMGRAGFLSESVPGRYQAKWEAFVDTGLDSPFTVARATADVEVVADREFDE